MTDDDLDPIEEVRTIRQRIWRKYKTPKAYFAHLKNVPSVEDLLAQVQKKIEQAEAKPKRRPASRRRKQTADA